MARDKPRNKMATLNEKRGEEKIFFRRPAFLALLTLAGRRFSSLVDPIRNCVGQDQSFREVRIDRASEDDKPVFQFHTGKHLGFGFGGKHPRFAGAPLLLREQAAFADFKGYVPGGRRWLHHFRVPHSRREPCGPPSDDGPTLRLIVQLSITWVSWALGQLRRRRAAALRSRLGIP